jgi:hypothetical protein
MDGGGGNSVTPDEPDGLSKSAAHYRTTQALLAAMKKLIIASAAIAALIAAPADAAHKRAARGSSRAYDGLWSVSIHTRNGPCDSTYRYPARIIGGRVMQADNDFSYQISGAVVSSGAIAVAVYRGG